MLVVLLLSCERAATADFAVITRYMIVYVCEF